MDGDEVISTEDVFGPTYVKSCDELETNLNRRPCSGYTHEDVDILIEIQNGELTEDDYPTRREGKFVCQKSKEGDLEQLIR